MMVVGMGRMASTRLGIYRVSSESFVLVLINYRINIDIRKQ